MMRRIIGILGMAVVAADGSVAADVQQRPTFKARTDVISVPVTVTRGRVPVTGLVAADFELADNGVRQEVEVVRAGDVPLDLTLVLTEVVPFQGRAHQRTLAASDATRAQLGPHDRLRVVFVDHQVRGIEAGPNYKPSEDIYAQALSWGRPTATGFISKGIPYPEVNNEYGFGIALFDGIFYALARPVAPDRRHLVVLFTDGHDTASTVRASLLPSLVARSDAVLHAVLWTTSGESPSSGLGWMMPSYATNAPGWRESFQTVDRAVQRSGGSLHRLERATDTLTEIIEAFRSSYVLRFTPKTTPAPGWHEIKVRVTKPGSHTIRARQGYEY